MTGLKGSILIPRANAHVGMVPGVVTAAFQSLLVVIVAAVADAGVHGVCGILQRAGALGIVEPLPGGRLDDVVVLVVHVIDLIQHNIASNGVCLE